MKTHIRPATLTVSSAMALSLVGGVAHAATPDGVWAGTVGDRVVTACFEGSSGSYYVNTVGRAIALVAADGKPGTYSEDRGDAPTTGTLQLTTSDSALTGTWISGDGKQTGKVALTRIPTREEHPCSSEAFNLPRLATVSRTAGPESAPADVKLRKFTALNGHVKGIELIDPAVAFDPARAVVERFNHDVILEFLECGDMFAAQSTMEGEADFEGDVSVELVSPNWLVLSRSTSYFCGNAHPESTFQVLTLKRDSGSPVDPATWLTMAPDAVGHRVVKGKGECKDAIAEAGFDVWPTKKGLAFAPAELPHVAAACGDTVIVPWKKLASELTPIGKALADDVSKFGVAPK